MIPLLAYADTGGAFIPAVLGIPTYFILNTVIGVLEGWVITCFFRVTAPLSAYQGFTQAESLRDRGRGKARKWRGATGSLMSPCQGTGHLARNVVKAKRSTVIMIFANCFSMGAGLILLMITLSLLDAHFSTLSAKLWSSNKILLGVYFWSYLASIFLEWPFCAKVLKEIKHTAWDSFRASVLAQTTSYLLIIAPIYAYFYHVSR